MKNQPVITICSSASFYRQAVEIQERLAAKGLTIVLPATAEEMKRTGNFDATHHKTWLSNSNDYHKKAQLIRGHFDKVAQGDAILVLNFNKNGKQNHIGGNVLMEMALAFYLRKPIFLINEAPKDSAYLEEILGLEPVILHGDADALPEAYAKAAGAR